MSFQGSLEPEKVLRGRMTGIVVIDKTLSLEGACADAKAVGDALKEKDEKIKKISENIETARKDMEPKIKILSVKIPVTGWVGNNNTVSVTGVTENNAVILVPPPEGRADYYSCGVFGASQAMDRITFGCDKAPLVDVYVNVMIFSPGGATHDL